MRRYYVYTTSTGEYCAYDSHERRIVGECLSAARRYPANKGAIKRYVARLNDGG